MQDTKLRLLAKIETDDFLDTEEIVEATLEVVETFDKALADKKITLGDAGLVLGVIDPIQQAIDGGSDVFRELAIMDNEQFEDTFQRGQAKFTLANAELDADITGIAKGILHAVRIYARGKYAKAA